MSTQEIPTSCDIFRMVMEKVDRLFGVQPSIQFVEDCCYGNAPKTKMRSQVIVALKSVIRELKKEKIEVPEIFRDLSTKTRDNQK